MKKNKLKIDKNDIEKCPKCGAGLNEQNLKYPECWNCGYKFKWEE